MEEEFILSPHVLLRIFRIAGWIEGLSLLALMFVAMPAKYIYGHPEATELAGAIHGFLFMAYAMLAFKVIPTLGWPKKVFFLAVLGASLPCGTFVFDHRHLSRR